MLRFLCGRAIGQPALLSVLQGSSSRGLLTKSGPSYLKQLSSSPRWISTSVPACSTAPRKDPSGHGQQSPDSAGPSDLKEPDPLMDHSIGLVQRYKKTFKQYGKVMIPVHLVTSSLCFGVFYYSAMKGVNLVPFLEYIGFPDRLVKLLENSQSGYALTAYAMYKIATPARYTITLGGTSLSVKYLRKHGYMSTPPPVKEYFQEKMEETKERISEKMEETKERISEKMEETKERFSGKMEETKDRFSERMEETKDKFSGKIQETKDKVGLRKKTE
uniref:Family with sequence similarity 210 member Aa n=1 Tax=Astyanax mexicanus TaxID=7994 RepID=W5LBY1_ASTMX